MALPHFGQDKINPIEPDEKVRKEIEDFHIKVKEDMGSDVTDLLSFIEALLKQNSDDMTVHTTDGSSYSIAFSDGSNQRNRMPGMGLMPNSTSPTHPQKEPSNFNIEVRRNSIMMNVYNNKKDNYLHTEFIVGEDEVYGKLKDLLYTHYVETKKKEIKFCVGDLYKVSKLDRQRKIDKFLKEDGE